MKNVNTNERTPAGYREENLFKEILVWALMLVVAMIVYEGILTIVYPAISSLV